MTMGLFLVILIALAFIFGVALILRSQYFVGALLVVIAIVMAFSGDAWLSSP